MRRFGVTPHVAQNTARLCCSAIVGRTTRHERYAKSINARRGVEKVFGGIKQSGGLHKVKLRVTECCCVDWSARNRLQPDQSGQSARPAVMEEA